MNTHLTSAVSRLPKELKKSLICPIGQTDAKIIVELIDLMGKVGLIEVKAILQKWKYLKDTEILDSLASLNAKETTLSEEGIGIQPEDDKPTKTHKTSLIFTRNWIYFKNLRLDVFEIHCYEKKDEYKVGRGIMEYYIIINPLSETTSIRNVTTHKTISYSDIEQRDKDFELLDDYISSFPGITFINKKDD